MAATMTEEEMHLRLNQRGLLAQLGALALETDSLDALLTEATRLVAIGVNTVFSKVLELQPGNQELLVRAGVGWRDGVVGHARLGADLASPAGYALITGEPVISNQLSTEQRFRTPDLLLEHGIRRAMNVVIRSGGHPFGVLEADSRHPGDFSSDDIAFLQAAASMLGIAIERFRKEQALHDALASRELLLREADHRIKNSLQMVASLLQLQRARLTEGAATDALDDAISRVRAIAEAHRALQQSDDMRMIGLDRMITDLCEFAARLNPNVSVQLQVAGPVAFDTERAIPLGLILSELLTNALRHAYPDGTAGVVEAHLLVVDDVLEVSVVDFGNGASPDPDGTPSLGTNIVRALARQIGAELDVRAQPGLGTRAILRLPRLPPDKIG
jgi:two-component sensor histidine kinase